ncbi:hypothetical protein ACHAWX_005284 [Stephanocyclus meneghinianus]
MRAINQISLASSLALLANTAASNNIHSTVPANPLPFQSVQPDGSSTPPLYFNGDGVDNYISDEGGFLVLNDGGWLVYAQNDHHHEEQVEDSPEKKLRRRRLNDVDEDEDKDERRWTPSRHAVGSIDPSTVSGLTTVAQRRRHGPTNRRLPSQAREQLPPLQTTRRLSSTPTTFHSLILLIRFADHTSRSLPPASQFFKFFNQQDLALTSGDAAPTGSVYEVFHENSYGILETRAKILDWITVSETEAYYANGEYGFQKFQEAIREALARVFDDATMLEGVERIDGLGVMHSGYGAEYGGPDCFGNVNEDRIWSHQAGSLGFVNPHYSNTTESTQYESPIASLVVPERYYVASALRNKCGSDITRVGIVVHEMGHQLGLPDLYDKTFEGNGIGNYDPMSRSWGWDGTGLYPPIFSAWSKITLGWLTPREITGNGFYTLGSSANVPQVYIIRQGFPDGEYLLIENRQPQGFDSQLQGGGIAVWHIDEDANDKRGYLGQEGWPRNGNRYKVTLIQADGDQDLERGVDNGDAHDLWHKNSEFTVLGPSSPGKKVVEADAYVVPNTDSIRHGNVTRSGIWIHNFTHLGEYMGFSVHGLTGNALAGYPSPNSTYAWVRLS